MVTGAADYGEISRTFTEDASVKSRRLEKTGVPALLSEGQGIIIGAIDESGLIRNLMESGKLDEAKAIEGRWEAFVVKQVDDSLVIAGSDARGTIYGIYTLSETIGVSPWYWFGDSAVEVRERIEADYRKAFVDCGPGVKYRGIFINDEENLAAWAKEKFPTENGTPDVNLYRHIFELLLRLKANTLWPAMHQCSAAFCAAKDGDVPVNAREADRYGIVIGSSHCEVMLRNNVGEWEDFKKQHKDDYEWKNGRAFDYTVNKEAILGYWEERLREVKNYETILTLGIRGIHDDEAECAELGAFGDRVGMMTDVINEQRRLIGKVWKDSDAPAQVFIPYKGMAEVYNGGLKLPSDVTVMWTDDNYGSLRQTPNVIERERSGGCGIYYHSSYWSWYKPKSYLWLNSTQIYFMAHQLQRAYRCGMKNYWILNVGSIKPGEIVTELFLKIAWDIDSAENIESGFLAEHAKRDFHLDVEKAERFAKAATEFYRLCGIKKAEFFGHESEADVSAPYFSDDMIFPFCVNSGCDEGQKLLERCELVADEMKSIYDALDERDKYAFYEQILYHVLSYRNAAEEYVYLWKNNLCAEEGRYKSALVYREMSIAARERIKSDLYDFWQLKGNKWERMINYDHPAPWFGMNEGIIFVNDSKYRIPIPADGIGVSFDGKPLRFDSAVDNKCSIDIFARGREPERWSLSGPKWLNISCSQGITDSETRVILSVDWKNVVSPSEGVLRVYGTGGLAFEIPVLAEVRDISFDGSSFIEANGRLVMEAEHYSENISGADGTLWAVVKNVGARGNCVTALPFDAEASEDIKTTARLRYRVYFKNSGVFKGRLYRLPTLNEGEGRGCRAAVGLGDGEIVVLSGNRAVSEEWAINVMRMYEPLEFSLNVKNAGWNDIFVYRFDSGIIIDKIVIETVSGAAGDSLSGEEESPNNIAEK